MAILSHLYRRTLYARGVLRVIAATAAICLGVEGASARPADPQGFDEYQVKAAFLVNLGRFVQWPVPDSRLVIGVLGDDPFGERLDQAVAARVVNGRTVVVRRYDPGDDFSESQILFVSASEARRMRAILGRAQEETGILTVGETSLFLREGGIVRFFVEGNRVRFEIDADLATRAGLRVNAQLLSLAAK